MSNFNVEERVANGVKLLDAKYPGWYNEVSLSKFDVQSHHNCVLGQVYGYYNPMYVGLNDYNSQALNAFELVTRYSVEDKSERCDKMEEEGNILNIEWKRVIAERQASHEVQ